MLHLTKDEQEYMNNNCRFIPPVYWEWLSSFKFNSGKIQASLDENGHLHIKVTDYLYKVTLYEVPILAIVSELRSRIFDNNCDLADVIKRLSPKIKLSNVAGIKFSEFGTRRRFSYNVQDIVVSAIKEGSIYCTGVITVGGIANARNSIFKLMKSNLISSNVSEECVTDKEFINFNDTY